MAARYPLSLLLLCLTAPLAWAAADVPEGYRRVAQQAGVPATVLYAVAQTESGVRLQQHIRPWPWTLNVAGRGYRYATRADACRALQQFLHTTSPRRIDVGLGQINLGWNRRFFASPCDALAPYTSLRVAARLLRQHFERWQSWEEAVGRYHRPAGGKPAQRYRRDVFRHLRNPS